MPKQQRAQQRNIRTAQRGQKHKREVSRTDASGIPTHTYHANATPGSVTNVEEWDVWP
jgi:hypothetical protein